MRQLKNRKIILALVVLIAIEIFAAAVCLAGQDQQTSTDNTAASEIKEIPPVNADGNREFAKEVEKKYDFIGRVDDVQEEGIVVCDTYFRFAPDAQLSRISVGSHVGMIFNKEKQVVLCEPVKKVRR